MAITRSVPLVDVAFDEVVRRIESGEYQVGEKLPSEAKLATEFGVSRPVIRELLARLRESGYVETLNGRGSFIRPQDSASRLKSILTDVKLNLGTHYSVDDLYTVRRIIEVESARLAARNATTEDMASIRTYYDAARTAEGDPSGYTAADISFHLAIAKATGNPLFPVLLSPIIEVVVRGIYDSVATFREGMHGGNQGHRKIYQALQSRDPEAAAQAMADHMTYSRGTFPEGMLRARSTTHDSDSGDTLPAG